MKTDMLILVPHIMSDAMLVSSSVVETAPAAYNPATSYALDATVSVAGAAGLITVYKSRQAANVGHTPAISGTWWKQTCQVYQAYDSGVTYAEDDRVQDNTTHMVYQSVVGANIGNPLTDTDKWIPVSANNLWAAFDDEIGTQTTGASPLKMVLSPGSTSGLALFDVTARKAYVTMRDGPGGATIATRTIDLDATVIQSFFEWFTAEFEPLTDVVITDLPAQFNNCELEVTLEATSGDASVGVLKPGLVKEIGATKSGARVGIVSYTKKEKNDFGNLTIVQRSWSKKASLVALTEKARFNRIYRWLASLQGRLCVFIGTTAEGFEPLLIYGFYNDFNIDIEYANHHLCSLEIEGVIQ